MNFHRITVTKIEPRCYKGSGHSGGNSFNPPIKFGGAPKSFNHDAAERAIRDLESMKPAPIEDTWSVWFFIAKCAGGILAVIIIVAIATYFIAK